MIFYTVLVWYQYHESCAQRAPFSELSSSLKVKINNFAEAGVIFAASLCRIFANFVPAVELQYRIPKLKTKYVFERIAIRYVNVWFRSRNY